jgi:hypothetical protein
MLLRLAESWKRVDPHQQSRILSLAEREVSAGEPGFARAETLLKISDQWKGIDDRKARRSMRAVSEEVLKALNRIRLTLKPATIDPRDAVTMVEKIPAELLSIRQKALFRVAGAAVRGDSETADWVLRALEKEVAASTNPRIKTRLYGELAFLWTWVDEGKGIRMAKELEDAAMRDESLSRIGALLMTKTPVGAFRLAPSIRNLRTRYVYLKRMIAHWLVDGISEAQRRVHRMEDPVAGTWAQLGLAGLLADLGHPEGKAVVKKANRMVQRMKGVARVEGLSILTSALALWDPGRALKKALEIPESPPYPKASALIDIAALSKASSPEHTRNVLDLALKPVGKMREGLGKALLLERMASLWAEANYESRMVNDLYGEALLNAVQGDSEVDVRRMVEAWGRYDALAALAGVRRIEDPYLRSSAMIPAVSCVLDENDRLFEEAVELAISASGEFWMAQLATGWAPVSIATSREVAGRIEDPQHRTDALLGMSNSLRDRSPQMAVSLLDEAETLIMRLNDGIDKVAYLRRIGEAMTYLHKRRGAEILMKAWNLLNALHEAA